MPPSITTSLTQTGHPSTMEDVELSTAQGYDEEQIRYMEEACIVIDENDQPVRPGSKKECILTPSSLALILSLYDCR